MEAKEYTGLRHFYVWKTDEPDLKCTRESQAFSLKCVKWHFKFSASQGPMGVIWDLCMAYDSEPEVIWNVTTYVKDKNGGLDLLCTTDYNHIYHDIHNEKKSPSLLTRMDSFKLRMNKKKYLHNDQITFVIVIDELVKSIFDVKRNSLGGQNEEIQNLEHLSNSMLKMFESKEFTDVEINCEGKIFFAHRNVLTVRSTVFAERFRRNMPGVFTTKLHIENVRCDVLEKFLVFLYSGKVVFESVTTAIELYGLAKKYDVFLLKQRCFYFLIANITRQTFAEILVFADTEHLKDIMHYIFDFILADKTFFNSVEWFTFNQENNEVAVLVKDYYQKKKRAISKEL